MNAWRNGNVEEVTVRMLYKQYKSSYADCKTVQGTYNRERKTIEVIIPAGRIKPSGVRGETFKTIWLMVSVNGGKPFEQGFRAISEGNAIKQAKRLGFTVHEDLIAPRMLRML